jgi:hypothetical protein
VSLWAWVVPLLIVRLQGGLQGPQQPIHSRVLAVWPLTSLVPVPRASYLAVALHSINVCYSQLLTSAGAVWHAALEQTIADGYMLAHNTVNTLSRWSRPMTAAPTGAYAAVVHKYCRWIPCLPTTFTAKQSNVSMPGSPLHVPRARRPVVSGDPSSGHAALEYPISTSARYCAYSGRSSSLVCTHWLSQSKRRIYEACKTERMRDVQRIEGNWARTLHDGLHQYLGKCIHLLR